MEVFVIERPKRIEAEQFQVNKKPWPSGIGVKGSGSRGEGEYVFEVNVFVSYKINDGDWIVHTSGETSVYSNEAFHQHYQIVEVKVE